MTTDDRTTMNDFQTIDRLLTQRRSCRGYLPDEVPRETIEQILSAAQHTASWCNTQPWNVHIVSGEARAALSKAAVDNVVANLGQPAPSDFPFPAAYTGVHNERRKEVGWQLYEAVGVERGDRDGSAMQMLRNFEFFGAPHVAIITTDADLGVYGAIDCGLYVNSFMLAAEALGLGTCAQAAIAQVTPAVREFLDLPDDRRVVCGIAFGHPDPDHPTAQFMSRRAPITDAATFVD
ncbi:nitroreductase [Aeromicrobium wangtongii]|uniref:Nitroreductase n=1 Tax=Aeromicrobium wangtongii TaxID=2969247 RepID=A0ABY5M736_9ACTN|nr:nitroreductase [Aeromicrobium wangtongii]MCD9199281.1 nitroreductase [Aeromicrobium wangtongii]UUP13642.1 nitroreductase [Aeromicrobium wangtongii]